MDPRGKFMVFMHHLDGFGSSMTVSAFDSPWRTPNLFALHWLCHDFWGCESWVSPYDCKTADLINITFDFDFSNDQFSIMGVCGGCKDTILRPSLCYLDFECSCGICTLFDDSEWYDTCYCQRTWKKWIRGHSNRYTFSRFSFFYATATGVTKQIVSKQAFYYSIHYCKA